jgi:hypothetical protein
MEEVAQTILQTVDANGGSITWQQMVEAVGERNKRHIWNALAFLKANGQAQALNSWNAAERKTSFAIVRM